MRAGSVGGRTDLAWTVGTLATAHSVFVHRLHPHFDPDCIGQALASCDTSSESTCKSEAGCGWCIDSDYNTACCAEKASPDAPCSDSFGTYTDCDKGWSGSSDNGGPPAGLRERRERERGRERARERGRGKRGMCRVWRQRGEPTMSCDAVGPLAKAMRWVQFVSTLAQAQSPRAWSTTVRPATAFSWPPPGSTHPSHSLPSSPLPSMSSTPSPPHSQGRSHTRAPAASAPPTTTWTPARSRRSTCRCRWST